MKVITKIICSLLIMSIVGCASMQTALEHKDLVTETKMSNAVFNQPVPKDKMTVYVSIKNTSDKEINVSKRVKNAIKSHGYKVVSNPNYAHYLLQANILKVGQMSKSASQGMLGGGYGSAISGAVSGAALGSLTDNTNTAIAGALIGSTASFLADSLVKDVNFVMVTDVQISERTQELIREQTQSSLSNGSSSQITQNSKRGTHWRKTRTRILSNANQVNLKFAEAKPALEAGLVKTISGIF